MRKKRTAGLPVLLLLFVISAGGLYYFIIFRDYDQIRFLIPLQDGTALFVRKGANAQNDWLIRENPKKGIVWTRALEGTLWGKDEPEGLQIGKEKIAVITLLPDLNRRLEMLNGQTGNVIWRGETDEILLLRDETRSLGGDLITWRSGSGEVCGRNWDNGQVSWKLNIQIGQEKPFAFRWRDYLVVQRSQGQYAIIESANGDTLPDILAEEIFPADDLLMYRTPGDSAGYHAFVLANPVSGQCDTLQEYPSESTGKTLRIAGGGWQGGQLTWMLHSGRDTSFIETMMPALSSRSVFFELARGEILNRGGILPHEEVSPAFNGLLQEQTEFVPFRVPFAKVDSAENLAEGHRYGEFIMLDTQKMEVAWRSKVFPEVYDYQIIRVEDYYYLNGRGGLLVQFKGDDPNIHRALFVPEMPHLQAYMFLKGQIWTTFRGGWLVIDAKTFQIIMKTDKDFEPTDMTDEVRLKFGIK